MLNWEVSVQRQRKKKLVGTNCFNCIKVAVCYGSQGWYLKQPTVILCSGSRNMIISQKSPLYSQSSREVCVMRTFGSKMAQQKDHKHKNKIPQISAETEGGKLVNSSWKWVFVCLPLLNLSSFPPSAATLFPTPASWGGHFSDLLPWRVMTRMARPTLTFSMLNGFYSQSANRDRQADRHTIWASVRWTLMEGAEEGSPWRVQHCHDQGVIKIFHWLQYSCTASVVVHRWPHPCC